MDHPDESFSIEVTVDKAFVERFDRSGLRTAIVETLRFGEVEQAELTVVVTDDQSMRVMNQQYRGIDQSTDILSFSAQEDSNLSELPPELADELRNYLGDLIVSFPYAAAQAERYPHSLDAELRLLVVHGTLHLLGYDHETEEHQEVMWAAQRTILDRLGDTETDWERGEGDLA